MTSTLPAAPRRPTTASPSSDVGAVRGARERVNVTVPVTMKLDDESRGTARLVIPLAALPADAASVKSVRSASPWGGASGKVTVSNGALTVELPGADLEAWRQTAGHVELDLGNDVRIFVEARASGPIHTDVSAVEAKELKLQISQKQGEIDRLKGLLATLPAEAAKPLASDGLVAKTEGEIASLERQLAQAKTKAKTREALGAADAVHIFLAADQVRELAPDTAKFRELGKQRARVTADLERAEVLEPLGDPEVVAHVRGLRAQRDGLLADQAALADGMRAKLLADPRLLEQVDRADVEGLEWRLGREKENLAHFKGSVVEEAAARKAWVGGHRGEWTRGIETHRAEIAAARAALASLGPVFADIPLK